MESLTRDLQLLQEYRTIPTGNLSDAMDQLDIPSGVLAGGPRLLSCRMPALAGYAFTVLQMPRHQTSPGKTQQLDVFNRLASPGDVVVIDVGGRLDASSCGGLLALRAKMRGLAGVVVNGCCRDAPELSELQFPVFCTGTSPRKSAPLETVGINVPVAIGGVLIRPGDLVVGDQSGLIVIPIERAQNVLDRARRIQATESLMERMVLGGEDYSGLRQKAEQMVSGEWTSHP